MGGLFRSLLGRKSEPRSSTKMSFPYCKICGKETSKAGNITNMILSGIDNPNEFNDFYGMLCADHAAELTSKIAKSKNLSTSDVQEANQLAMIVMMEEFRKNSIR